MADRSSPATPLHRASCALGAVLQRLTIDAVTPDEMQTCLHAIRAGFAAEGLVLTRPTDPAAIAALGPRLTPDVLARLRRLACPSSAAALMLALATDAGASSVASCSANWISPTAGRVGLLPGTYRIPLRARPILRAALLDNDARGLPVYRVLVDHDGGLLLTQRMANLIGRAAVHAGVPPPLAATTQRSDSGLDGPFAADFTRYARVTGAELDRAMPTSPRTLAAVS